MKMCETLRKGAFRLQVKHTTGSSQICNAYLAGYFPNGEHAIPVIDALQTNTQPKLKQTPDEFLEEVRSVSEEEEKRFRHQMKNKVRKCPQCGKPVAFTMIECNGCGYSLAEVPISYTDNIFTSFIFGFQRGPFPYTISLRAETPSVLVFDDLLSMSMCHLNIIPADVYLPDWRFLLRNPQRGMKLIDSLFSSAVKVAKEQFYKNVEWRKAVFRNGEDMTESEFEQMIICGFNFPPSQYQLHLQFMIPPFTPFHYYQYLEGRHFTKDRFFPIEYTRKILSLNHQMDIVNETSIEEIVRVFRSKGVDYSEMFDQLYADYGERHRREAKWRREQFESLVCGSSLLPSSVLSSLTSPTVENGDGNEENRAEMMVVDASSQWSEDCKEQVSALQKRDKESLQNYGRPYTSHGRCSGTYYGFAKGKGLLQEW